MRGTNLKRGHLLARTAKTPNRQAGDDRARDVSRYIAVRQKLRMNTDTALRRAIAELVIRSMQSHVLIPSLL